METLKKKHELDKEAREEIAKRYIELSETTPLDKLAIVLGDPEKLSQIKNCYITYKKLGKTNASKFLMQKH